MNVKKAKRIRQELGYKPHEPREYGVPVFRSFGSKSKTVPTTRVNLSTSTRGVYLQYKRDAKQGK